MIESEEKVYDKLGKLNIKYELFNHHQAHTMEEIEDVQQEIGGIYCKNLFLRNSKGDCNYLVLVCGDKKVDTRELAKDIKSTRLSFNSSERLMEFMKLTPGSVGPFGLLSDENNRIQVLIDEDIVESERISFHPNNNAKTVVISYIDLIAYLKDIGNKYEVIKLWEK